MTRYEQLQKKIEDARKAQDQAQNPGFKHIWDTVALMLEIRRDHLLVEDAERMVL